MQVSPVSFGKVTVVTGKSKKMANINRRITTSKRPVKISDITSLYKNSASNGEYSQAVKRGEVVDMYVTGNDLVKLNNSEPGWESTQNILLKVENSFSANKMSVSEVIKEIFK